MKTTKLSAKVVASLKKAWAGRKVQAALLRSQRETKRIAKLESARVARAAWSAKCRARRVSSLVLDGIC